MLHARTCSLVAVALCSALLAPLVACTGNERPDRVVVLGIDGLDPRAIDLLMSEGKLPSFARMRQDGAYGTLLAAPPLLSPVLWTTIATGKTPDQHGIGHFVTIDPSTGAELPATSSMRKAQAIWSIASDHDRSVATVGWWATWPPEPVNGVVVSDHTCYHFLFREGEHGGSSGPVTYPAELLEQITPLIRRPRDVSYEQVSRFLEIERSELEGELDFTDDVSHFRWALATAESYRDIGLELWQSQQPDLLMVYIEATDSVSHLFGHVFRGVGLEGELAEQQRRYGQAVEQTYIFADELLGEYLDALDSRTTLVVMSDHGFELGRLHDDPSKTRDLRKVSEQYHHELGVVYAFGNRVKRNARIEGATQLDITPTLLALLGLDVARDMPGRVLHEAFEIEPPARQVASYERPGKKAQRSTQSSVVDEKIRSHLESLGYLSPSQTSSPKGERNLAAVHFSNGEYEKAAEIYARLIEQSPADSTLYTSLAGCLGAMERYDEALAALTTALRLDPLNAGAYHNRAALHERRGDVEAAIADYRTAVRYAPRYEASRSALIRLTGTAEIRPPRTVSERRAAALAEQASGAARRGAYTEAKELLEQAATLAPEYARIYQYQANVAYLMQDLDAAELALSKALELEPENELFRHNLSELRRQRAASRR